MKRERTPRKHWNCCPHCFQLVYSAGFGTGNHTCPKSIQAIKELELDMIIDEELSTWKDDLHRFWNSKDTKFNEWLVNNKRI